MIPGTDALRPRELLLALMVTFKSVGALLLAGKLKYVQEGKSAERSLDTGVAKATLEMTVLLEVVLFKSKLKVPH